jgi:hypothetical protein
MHAGGRRETARVWPGSPLTVRKAGNQRPRRARRGSRRCDSPALLRRGRGSEGVRRRGRSAVAAALRRTRGGARGVAKRRRAGEGLRASTPRVRWEPRGVDDARPGPVWRAKPAWHRWGARASCLPVGGPTSGLWRPLSPRSGRPTPSRASASPSPCAHEGSGWSGGRSAFPRRHAGTMEGLAS